MLQAFLFYNFFYILIKIKTNIINRRTFSNFKNEWEVIDGPAHKSTSNIQVMEAAIESNSGKCLEGRVISFTKMTITNNHSRCNPSGTISNGNVSHILKILLVDYYFRYFFFQHSLKHNLKIGNFYDYSQYENIYCFEKVS